MNPAALPPGLILVHGNRIERMRGLLVEWMRRYPLAPLERETILVHSNGIAQWLQLALAADPDSDESGCGIAAALEMSLPSRFLWQAYRSVLGAQHVPEVSPFDKEPLTWRLMRLLPRTMTGADYAPLQSFLKDDDDRRKRFQLAQRLADLFDQYQVYRADWLEAWAMKDDVLVDGRGRRRPLESGQRWQADLWRRLLDDVAASQGAAGTAGRASVHAHFMQRVGEWSGDTPPPGLPRRVIVFGISSLPQQSLEVLAAIGRWSQVLMCVHNPCEHFWADIVADRDLLRMRHGRHARRPGMPEDLPEELLHLHAHPLLAAWGKQGRDFIGLLEEHDSPQARERHNALLEAVHARIDLFEPAGGDTLLRQLQDDVLALRPVRESRDEWPPIDPEQDDSIRFHRAHGPQREVEVLHDALLAAFDADPTLRPRDVIVMVPDIEAYAPHIEAVFGLVDRNDPRHIPFSLADRGRRSVDPLVDALGKLLGLPQSRFAASDLLDLVEVPAVRARFGIDDDQLAQLHRWIRGAGIRWGLHARHRDSVVPFGGDANGAAAPNTWLFGLRRMLLGYAVGAGAAPWHGIEPYDEIGGLDAALLGPLVRLVDAIDDCWSTLRTDATPEQWCDRLRALCARFFLAADRDDAFTLLQLESALQRWQATCADAGLDEALPLSVVGEHWLSALEAGGLSQRFFAGAVTFATLMPMRAVPFRRVCLLGMNDGDYPRARIPMDFDLMGADYRPGDRSRREDDRYLFLEAILSARDHLHVSWVGRSILDNSERPPSVLVGQLRDHIVEGWRLEGAVDDKAEAARQLLAALTIEHRLQPFSPEYFGVGPASRLFTYAREWRAQAAPCAAASPLRLPPLAREEPLTVRELADFLKDPVKAFFGKRLNVVFTEDGPESEDHEPFDLDGLDRWQLQNELILAQARAVARGEPVDAALCAAQARIERRGVLPAGAFGTFASRALAEPMPELFAAYVKALERWPNEPEGEEPVRHAVHCDGQCVELADWLTGSRTDACGERGVVVLEPSDLIEGKGNGRGDGAEGKVHYRGAPVVRHWIAHLAAHLAGGPRTTVILSKKGQVTLEPMEVAQATALLETLLRHWREGMRRPLPLAIRTGFAWLMKGDDEARKVYVDAYSGKGEGETNPCLKRVYPDYDSLTASGEFAPLTQALLEPLLRALPAKPAKDRKHQNTGEGAAE